MRVAFVDGQVLMWFKGKTIDDAIVIGEQDEGLYMLDFLKIIAVYLNCIYQ